MARVTRKLTAWSAAIVAFSAFSAAHAATYSSGDYGGADLTLADGDVIEGTLENVGVFSVPAGVTVSVGATGIAAVEAQAIVVDGTIDATGAGFVGGTASRQSSGTPGSGPGGGSGGVAQQCAHPTGGGGAGHGNMGGAGRNSLNAVTASGGQAYGTLDDVAAAQRGSGGGGGGSFLCSLNAVGGDGGAGGGVVALSATSLDVSGTIRVDGARGGDARPSSLSSGTAGGGGGSAGTIILDGGDVVVTGVLSARGGDGGDIVTDPNQTFAGGGGGGAGGRVKIRWAISIADNAIVDVTGGVGGLSGTLGGVTVSDDGQDGTTSVEVASLPPVAADVSVTTDEDTAVAITLTATDPDGDPMTFAHSSPSSGTLTGTAPNLTFVPDPDFVGSDSFTFTATDGFGLVSNTATVSIDVRPVNDPPVVTDVVATTDEDVATTFSVVATDPEGDSLTFTAGNPPNGTVTALGSADFSYTPDPNFFGVDTFSVVVSDGIDSVSARVEVSVRPVNDPPTASDLNLTTVEDTPLDFVVTGSDVDGDPLTFTVGAPTIGSVDGAGANYRFTPPADVSGRATMSYTVSDGTASATATIAIEITPANDPPVVADLDLTVDEDQSTQGTIQASDPDGDVLVYTVTSAQNGVANVDAGVVSYAPNADFNGNDSFQVTVSDGAASATARVDVVVHPVNDAPTVSDLAAETAEDVPAVVNLVGDDIDGDTLTYTVEPPVAGTVVVSGATATFTPPLDANGTFTFVYRANDGVVDSAPATVTVEVGPENDPPVWDANVPADGELLVVDEGTPLVFSLSASDPDDEPITYAVDPLPAGASFDPDTGAFAWTPQWTDGGVTSHAISATDGASTILRNISVEVVVLDTDGDGIPDTRELELSMDPASEDSDGDTIADLEEVVDPFTPSDVDADGIIDALDDDSDDDTLLDVDEAGDADLTTPAFDRDQDGMPDFRDLDSDGDDVDDALDNCPIVANPEQADNDQDGFGDLCDQDTDGDGLADELERSIGFDPFSIDSDADFIADAVEFGFGVDPSDVDGDGIFDGLDLDSDGDGILDSVEAGDENYATPPNDTDFDGRADFRDVDSDDDTFEDGVDNCRLVFNPGQDDLDQNGVGDACDGDTDGDGIDNEVDNCPTVANAGQDDRDGNGIGDACDVDPVDPVDPTDPVDPVDPTDPTDPIDPADPNDQDPDDVVDPNDRFANSSFSGGSGCASAPPSESAPPFAFLLLALVAAVTRVGRRRR